MFQATSAHHQEGTITIMYVLHDCNFSLFYFQCVIPENFLIQFFPPDDDRLTLETCRGGKINTLKKVRQVG
jgi:hypothetical protein